MKQELLLLYFLLFSVSLLSAQVTQMAPVSTPKFPGGVLGAEMWYICDYANPSLGANHAQNNIVIKPCGSDYDKALLNFNPAINSAELCLKYRASIENSVSRDVFFVGKPRINHQFSHLHTSLNPAIENLPFIESDTIINHFDLGLKNSYIKNLGLSYNSDNNAQVNYYRWNNYRIDHKYKSYGVKGECDFFIGKKFLFPENDEPQSSFAGRFPEFISFPHELNENEKIRVESYLALKYGMTLSKQVSYKSANNLKVWNSANNDIFHHYIFGLGKDDISGLNQLQSESVHRENYLVAAIGNILHTNPEKQAQVSIEDENFLVMGNNNMGGGVGVKNQHDVRPLRTVWLSQKTGKDMESYPISFKINLEDNVLGSLMQQYHLKLWMLHDKFVNNQEVSSFNDNYIEYYEPADLQGFDYGLFKDVFFDTDHNTYDQYTFGVGPEMIIQVRLKGDCREPRYKAEVVISGGKADYLLKVYKDGTEIGHWQESDNRFDLPIPVEGPADYLFYVKDAQGITAEVELEVVPYQIEVNLGPDQELTVNQPEILLDGSNGVSDPNATYQWYFNGDLIDGEYDSTLLVSEEGKYTVKVLSEDHSCESRDSITITRAFSMLAESPITCGSNSGFLTIDIFGGTPNYYITLHSIENGQESPTPDYIYVSDGDLTGVTGISFGQYKVYVTDNSNNGETLQQTLEVVDPHEGLAVDLYPQLEIYFSLSYNYLISTYPLIDGSGSANEIDASVLVTSTNVSYEWYRDDELIQTDPVLELETISDPETGEVVIYEVRIYNTNTGCFIVDGFAAKGYWVPVNSNSAPILTNDPYSGKDFNFTTKVYPNPSAPYEVFNYDILADQSTDVTVQLYTLQGILLAQRKGRNNSRFTFNFSIPTSGVYFIKTTSRGEVVTDKIIIE